MIVIFRAPVQLSLKKHLNILNTLIRHVKRFHTHMSNTVKTIPYQRSPRKIKLSEEFKAKKEKLRREATEELREFWAQRRHMKDHHLLPRIHFLTMTYDLLSCTKESEGNLRPRKIQCSRSL